MVDYDTMFGHASTLHQAALDVLHTPVLIHDHQRILYANIAALGVLGARDESQVVGRPIAEIVHPDGAQAGAARRQFVMEHGHAITGVPLKLMGVDGIVRYVTADAQAIHFAGDQTAILVTAVLTRMVDSKPRTTPPE